MPNIASVLKAEIARLARKEIKTELEALKKANAHHRALIASLRRQMADMEKRLATLSKPGRSQMLVVQRRDEAEEAGETKRRFSAARLTAHREKLGLSVAQYSKLVGISRQTLYNWEEGKSRPRGAQLHAVVAVRAMGKRDVQERFGDT